MTDLQKALSEIEARAKAIKDAKASSTEVNGWYAHQDSVRGPFNRWFEITEVRPEYKAYVASRNDDAFFASTAMNEGPKLANEAFRLVEAVKVLSEALEFYTNHENWEISTAYAENTTICGDDHYCYKGDYFFGGKHAKVALAKAAEILKGEQG